MLKNIWHKIPEEWRFRFYELIYRTPFWKLVPFWYRKKIVKRSIKFYVVSFPKCGRTWLKLMLGKVFELKFGLKNIETNDLMDFDELAAHHRRIPNIEFTHDDNPHYKKPEELELNKNQYQDKRIIFLIRDPRDVIVSLYFQMSKRKEAYQIDPESDKTSFLRSERGSLETLITWYNVWAKNRDLPSDFLVLRYEDIHKNPEKELRRILRFLGINKVDGKAIRKVIGFTNFENMHQMEISGLFKSNNMLPGSIEDPESYKTRRGKIGGYNDYLSQADIDYINDRLTSQLSNFYFFYM